MDERAAILLQARIPRSPVSGSVGRMRDMTQICTALYLATSAILEGGFQGAFVLA